MRNFIRVIDYILLPIAVILMCVGKRQRLGDLVAKTYVQKKPAATVQPPVK